MNELTPIESALKKKEFRQMLHDYIEEIQDPADRKQFEEQIIQLEAERGVFVTFVHPEPGFVVKTSVDGALKCFVNVAKSEVVRKPTKIADKNLAMGGRGFHWFIPVAPTAARIDLDAHGNRCRVYGAIFHPHALFMAERSKAFRLLIIDTALDAVERGCMVQLDRNNLKFPNLKYVGVARAFMIRKMAESPPANAGEPRVQLQKQHSTVEPKSEFTVPRYVIKHRCDVDLAEYTNELDARLNLTVPRMLIVEIDLPLLASSAECNLIVTPQSIYLLSERPGAKYRLKLDLPFAVNKKNSSARYLSNTRVLCIELPVVQQSVAEQRSMHNTLLHLSREDSGVESDMREDTTSNYSALPIEELPDTEEDGGVSLPVESTTEAKDEVGDATTLADDTANSVAAVPFLKRSIQYQFPAKFACNVLKNVMSLMLNVRNVQPESVEKSQHAYNVHVKFFSVECGFYPIHHAFYLQLPVDKVRRIVSAEVEAWGNNVVLNVKLATSGENLHKYWAGVDASDLKEYNVQGKFHVARNSRRRNKSPPAPLAVKISSSLNASVERSECYRPLEIAADRHNAQLMLNEMQRQKNEERRSLSESKYDDISKTLHIHQQREEAKQKYKQQQRQSCQKQALVSNDNSAAQLRYLSLTKPPATQSMAVPMALNENNGAQQHKQRSYSECLAILAAYTAASATLPSFSAATATLPSFSAATATLPSFSAATATLPSFSAATATLPSFSAATATLPSFSAATATLPSFSAASATLPSFSAASAALPASFGSPGKGILKQYSCYDHAHSFYEKNLTARLSVGCKKAVRFNDVIMQRVFRRDSGILGQRKKNQKRRDRKQRAWQRRHSDGDSTDYEEHDKPTNVQYFKSEDDGGHVEHNRNMSSGKRAQHDSGLDLSASGDNASDGVNNSGGRALSKAANIDGKMLRSRLESDVEAGKNTMMFDMDM